MVILTIILRSIIYKPNMHLKKKHMLMNIQCDFFYYNFLT
jgi:hypothetical protein